MPSNELATPHSFASDNWSGIHPEVLAAITAANTGAARAYGGDAWTERFQQVARELFGAETEAFPVFNGTGANVLALQAATPRWGAVICARNAHINTAETGAPEKTGGLKLLPLEGEHGKLTPEIVAREAWGWGDEHRASPDVVSISQVTEVGTCYTPDEIRALADQAHELGMLLHVDGSRLGNAAAHLGTSLAAITNDAGVDLLSLGGTKNGALAAEAVVVLRPGSTPGITSLRKMNLQLSSKMRFISAQLTALYGGDLWLRSARHANAMADRLAEGLEPLGATLLHPVESNAVFCELDPEVAARADLRTSRGKGNTYRLMCAFDTTPEAVDELLATLRG
ncbi:threonine aldolase family protein [Leucobacter denitrificans]|uniref:Threonine aldolase n=1 Tax=Leucobacter denitrificans TaxID=683042 RepID=A0A7G9S244_9MICO|nr:beta-eliminating lyase-related protein [Leucobacter denitrificans]QNN61919.1 threonine aldolase [Leucobacter denitrificans]